MTEHEAILEFGPQKVHELSATGGEVSFHEIRDGEVRKPADTAVNISANKSSGEALESAQLSHKTIAEARVVVQFAAQAGPCPSPVHRCGQVNH